MPTFEEDAEESYGWTARDMEIAERIFRRILESDGRKPAERGRWHKFIQGILYGKLTENLNAGESALVQVYDPDTDSPVSGDTRTVHDRLLAEGKRLLTDTFVYFARLGNAWYLISSGACPEDQ